MFGVSYLQLAVFVAVVALVGVGRLRRKRAEPAMTDAEKVEAKRADAKSSRGYLRSQQVILGVVGVLLIGIGEVGWGIALVLVTGLIALMTERSIKKKLDSLDEPPH